MNENEGAVCTLSAVHVSFLINVDSGLISRPHFDHLPKCLLLDREAFLLDAATVGTLHAVAGMIARGANLRVYCYFRSSRAP